MRTLLTGNEAAARAVKLARAQVIAAYPITPQTSLAEKLASYVASGELRARCLTVESEISALAACIGGSLSGARAFTATSSQGLALMHELLHWSSGARLPIVLVNVNRSLAAPWSLGIDQTDSLSQRDTGWLQIYCGSAQEALDAVIIAFRLAESTLLPVMVCTDGFLVSHYTEPVDVPEQGEVDRFLPRRKAEYRLDPRAPATYGGGVVASALYDLRKRLYDDTRGAERQFDRFCRAYEGRFGRRYQALDSYGAARGDVALVASGALAGTARAYLEDAGPDCGVGLLQMRLLRPFPTEALRRAARNFKKLVVLDRDLSPAIGGVWTQEIRAALHGSPHQVPVLGVITGLGGVDVSPAHLSKLVARVRAGEGEAGETLWLEA